MYTTIVILLLLKLNFSPPNRHERPSEETRRHGDRGRGPDQGLLQDPPSDPQIGVQDAGLVPETQVRQTVPATREDGEGEERG